MYQLLEVPRPSSDLGGWRAVVGPFTEVVGWTRFGDFFLRNPDDGYYAFLMPMLPRFVALSFCDRASLAEMLLTPKFVERRLRPADALVLTGRLGTPDLFEVFVPAALPPPEEFQPEDYERANVWTYAAAAAAHHNMGTGTALDLLLRHIRWVDDPALWRVALDHILWGLSRTQGMLVQVGRCSHWQRPHQTRWTADGGFAWPTGYGSGQGGFARDALPQFDWSVMLAWTGHGWELARDKSAKPAVRVTVPSRTSWHEQAAVHTVWMTGREKERRFYGFRRADGGWRCTGESEWRADRAPARRKRWVGWRGA